MIATASPSWATNEKDVDFDFIARNLDKLIKALAPSFPISFAGTDGDSNGINEDDTLAMFGSVLRGNVSPRNRVNIISSTEQEAMRLDFVNNRASADDNMRAVGFLGLNCTLLRAVLTDIPDCRLSSVLKSTQALGPTVGGLVADLLLDLIAALLTSGEYNNNDTTGSLGYVNTVIAAAVQAAADALGQGGLAGTLIPDFQITNAEFQNNYERWGSIPRPTNGTPPRRNAFGATGSFDLANLVVNGTFTGNTNWTLGTNWTIPGTNALTAASATSSTTQAVTLVNGRQYFVSYTVTRTAGSVRIVVGGTAGTTRSAAGSYFENITAGAGANVAVEGIGGFSGTVDNLIVANTNGVEYTLASGNRESWLQTNSVGVYPTGITNDQPMRLTSQPPNGVYAAGINLNIGPIGTAGAGNATPYTYLWEDATDFGDKDSPIANTYYGITPLTDTGSYSGTATNTLTISNLTYADHDSHRYWIRVSDQVTIYNTLPIGNGTPSGSAAADGLGGRGTGYAQIKVVETLANGTARGPISQCSGPITFNAYASNGDDSADADTDNDPPTYLWYKGATPGTLASTGITTNTLSIANVTAGDAGYYACDVTHYFNTGSTTTRTNLVQLIFPSTPAAPSAPDLQAASDTGSSSTDNITNDTTPTFTGSGATAGDTVTLTIDGVSDNTAVADGSGNWTITASAVAPGARAIRAFATNCAGSGPVSSALNITVDTTAPAAPGAPDLAASSDSGSSNTDNITNDTTPDLTGTAEASTTVTVTSSLGGTIGTSAGPNWSITSIALADGNHTVTATATDLAGNTSGPSSGLALTIDTTAPAAPSAPDLTSATDSGSSNSDNITNDNTPDFTGTAESGATVRVFSSLVGQIGASTGPNYSVTSSALADNAHTITATATDAAGNVSAASSGTVVTIDTLAPGVPSVPDLNAASDSGTSNSDNITNVTLPGFSGSAETGSTVTLLVDGSPNGTIAAPGGSYTALAPSVALGQGVRNISARATDAAGNTGSASAALAVTIDTAAPAQPGLPDLAASSDSGVSNTDNNTSDTTPDLSGSAEADTLVTVTSSIDGVVGTPTATGGTWNLTPGLSQGTHSITVTARDAAGNTSVASTALSLVIDTTAPAAPATPDLTAGTDSGVSSTDNITSDNTPNFSGTADNGNTVNLSSSLNGAIGSAVATGGNYLITASTLNNGTHTITATQTDLAGNVSPSSSGLSVTIDTAAPVVSTESPARGLTIAALTTVQVTFDRSVSGLIAGRLTVNGSAATSLAGSGAGPYTFSGYAVPADGAVNVVLSGTGVTSLAGIAFAGDSWSYTKDSVVPTTTISTVNVADGGSTNDSTIDFTAVFSQGVSGFVSGDISVTGGTVTFFLPISTTNYLFTVTASGEGAISVQVPADVANRITAPNPGNTASNTYAYTYDITAPTVTVNSLNTNNNRPALSGTVNDNAATISVTVDSQTVPATNNGDGTWSLGANVLTALADGTYNVSVTATDAATNAGSDASVSELVVDATAPVVTVNTLTTADTTPALGGTVDDTTATISVQVGSQTVVGVNNGDGTWSLADNVLTALGDGTYNVIVTATDSFSNSGSDATAGELTIDTTPPVVGVDVLLTNDSTPALSGTVNEAGATVTVQVDAQTVPATNNGDGTWSLADNVLTALADGAYTVTVTAVDSVSNIGSDAEPAGLTVDTTGPVISLLGDSPANVNCGDGYAEGGYTATDTRQGDVSGSVTVGGDTVTAFSVPGAYQITYDVADSLGNAATQAVRTVNVLANCPLTVTENAAAATREVGESYTMSVSVSGAIGPVDYQWQKDDGSKAWQDISGETTDTLSLSNLTLGDSGDYRCEVNDTVWTAYSGVIVLNVVEAADVPAAGLAGLGIAAAATALAGAFALRRKR